ncbi:hypothetical protein BH708_03070 [Brachybacterium sp. P6-10-X1]|uniref:hypothetical protein n=1 Tax=Brachybacterium sp. P6-10-X1 TaxID=1903186 RepID=UPI000971899C|nr:hypothetical protein [Brachybacterium sp. P6-10-X1]APX31870.1 hypothetical protein BH708_03070 [Brachybacterium sp. P6-10-X1]
MFNDRIKRLVHPEGYGFWLDPDGFFTLFGAIIATAALSVPIGVPDTVRQIGDSTSEAPVVTTLVSAAVYLAMSRAFASVVQAWAPADFEATGRFHAWIAGFGVVLTLGIVVLVSWPLPDFVDSGYAGTAVRLAAIVGYLVAGGIPLRRVLKRRNTWTRNKIEELQQNRG